jgi:hypothetical protein
MSDETAAGTATTPEAPPAPQEAPEAPPRPQEQPPAAPPAEGGEGEGGEAQDRPEPPRTAKEARERLRQRGRGQGQESVAARMNRGEDPQPRDEKGRYTSPEGEASGEQEPSAAAEKAPVSGSSEDPGATPAGDATPDAAPTEGPPEGMVRIPLPDEHPLRRSRGVTHLDFPADQENYGRWAVNQGMRVSEYEETRQRADQIEAEARQARAEAEFWRNHAGDFLTPEFYQVYNDLKETYGEDRANAYKAGVLREAEQKVMEARRQAHQQHQAERYVGQAEKFRDTVLQHAPKLFPHWSEGEVRQALAAYGQWMEQNRVDTLSAQDFKKVAGRMYAQHPEVRKELMRRAQEAKQTETQRIREETEQEFKTREAQRLREAASNRARNPMQRVPHVNTGRSAGVEGEERPRTAKEMREAVRQRARGLGT